MEAVKERQNTLKQSFLKRAKEHIGKTYGYLTVEDVYTKRKPSGKNIYYAKCSCVCGTKEHHASLENLRSGGVKSCGCLRQKQQTMGMHATRPYRIWYGMIRSCYSEKDTRFKRRGEKGIIVIPERRNFAGRRKDNEDWYSDEAYFTRKNPFKNFDRENCYWSIAYNISQFDLYDKYKDAKDKN